MRRRPARRTGKGKPKQQELATVAISLLGSTLLGAPSGEGSGSIDAERETLGSLVDAILAGAHFIGFATVVSKVTWLRVALSWSS